MRAEMSRAKRNESHDLLKLRRLKPVTLDFWQESILRLLIPALAAYPFATTGVVCVAEG
jgi:hypothetical protein